MSSNLQQQVTRGMMWNTAFLPLRTIASFVANIVIVRTLTQDDFGVFVQVTALLATIGLYVDLGIERSLVRFVPEVEKNFGRRGLWQFFGVTMAVKLAILAPVILLLLLRSQEIMSFFQWGSIDASLIPLICLLLVLGAFSDVLYQFLIAFFRIGGRNTLDVVTTLVQAGLVIVLVTRGGVYGALLALALSTLLNVILGGWIVARSFHRVNVRPALQVTWQSIYRRLAKLSALSYGMNLTTYFYDMPFVILVLTYMKDEAGWVLFGIAFGRVVMPALRVIFTPLSGVQMPMFARIRAENNPAKQAEAYQTLVRFLCLWLIPASIGLAVLARPLIILFFQARYADAASAAAVLAIFLFAESLFSPAQIVLLVNDRYRLVLYSRALALLSIPLLFLAIPRFSAVGAAFAIGIARLAAQLTSTWLAGREYQLQFPTAFFARILLISLGMGFVMLIPLVLIGSATPFENILKIILSSAVGVTTFALLFKLVGGLEERDKQRILTLPIPFKHTVVNWL